jgi:hypothetical protein
MARPTDAQLRQDAQILQLMYYPQDTQQNAEAMRNRTTAVSVATDPQQPNCRQKLFAVSSGNTTAIQVLVGRILGYTYVTNAPLVEGQTHAEHILINWLIGL